MATCRLTVPALYSHICTSGGSAASSGFTMHLKIAAILFMLVGAGPALAQSVKVSEPWVRATPPGAKVGAAYMVLQAAPGAGDTLISASSPVAGVTEIHNHIMDGGIARMRRVDGITVPAGGSVALAPGGYHVMLMDLKAPLMADATIKLKLVFQKAGEVEVDAKVRPIGAHGAGSGSGAAAGAAKH